MTEIIYTWFVDQDSVPVMLERVKGDEISYAVIEDGKLDPMFRLDEGGIGVALVPHNYVKQYENWLKKRKAWKCPIK